LIKNARYVLEVKSKRYVQYARNSILIEVAFIVIVVSSSSSIEV